MANIYEYLHFLETNQVVGWVALNKKIKESLKNKWNGNLHSLTFRSGIAGYFYVDNNIFHFTIFQNHIGFTIIAKSKQEADKLSKKFKTVIDSMFE